MASKILESVEREHHAPRRTAPWRSCASCPAIPSLACKSVAIGASKRTGMNPEAMSNAIEPTRPKGRERDLTHDLYCEIRTSSSSTGRLFSLEEFLQSSPIR
jgi:hypothetical protein